MSRLLLLLLLGTSVPLFGQTDPPSCDSLEHWAPRESRWWGELRRATTEWDLSSEIQIRWQEIVCEAAWELEQISVRRSEAEARNEVALADTLAALRAAEGAVRNARNARLLATLPMELWPPIQEVLAPPKPAVLHFGVHDRMKCEVCVPSAE